MLDSLLELCAATGYLSSGRTRERERPPQDSIQSGSREEFGRENDYSARRMSWNVDEIVRQNLGCFHYSCCSTRSRDQLAHFRPNWSTPLEFTIAAKFDAMWNWQKRCRWWGLGPQRIHWLEISNAKQSARSSLATAIARITWAQLDTILLTNTHPFDYMHISASLNPTGAARQ